MAIITHKIGTMEYLAGQTLGAAHCFTTRHGGVSTGHLSSLNLGIRRGDPVENVAENYRRLGALLGFSTEDVVAPRQIHSDIILPVTGEDRGNCLIEGASPVCDGLITNTPGLALAVFTADCTPILYHDPVTGAVGAAHAGWRGTAAGIAQKTVEAMTAHYGCRPENIRSAIGPHIGPCCFETDRDVPDAMVEALGQEALAYITRRGEKYFVDLTGINCLFLHRAGVEQIETTPECTACQPDRFWSYRRVGAARGSQGAIILCPKEATP